MIEQNDFLLGPIKTLANALEQKLGKASVSDTLSINEVVTAWSGLDLDTILNLAPETLVMILEASGDWAGERMMLISLGLIAESQKTDSPERALKAKKQASVLVDLVENRFNIDVDQLKDYLK